MKELIDKCMYDDGFIWNPSVCRCECDTSCDFEKYLDYENCKCRKKLIVKIIGKCNEDIDGNEMVYNATLNNYRKVYNSCTLYIVFLIITFILIIGLGIVCHYFCLHKLKNCFDKLPY